jgi:hypothetical protein
MLGRLEMGIRKAIASYNRLMMDAYSDKKLGLMGGPETFKATTLERGTVRPRSTDYSAGKIRR